MNDIVLIGNSKINKSKNIGHIIDGFPEVLRYNRFKQVFLYQEYLGTKCTIWAINKKLVFDKRQYYTTNWKINKSIFPELKGCVLITHLWNKSECQHLTNICQEVDTYGHLFAANTLHATKLYSDYWKFFLKTDVIGKPATGIISILYYSMIYNRIFLHNFDHGKTSHYWGVYSKSDVPGGIHNWNLDKLIVNDLIKQGKVKYLCGQS